jgi:hypothetical protein
VACGDAPFEGTGRRRALAERHGLGSGLSTVMEAPVAKKTVKEQAKRSQCPGRMTGQDRYPVNRAEPEPGLRTRGRAAPARQQTHPKEHVLAGRQGTDGLRKVRSGVDGGEPGTKGVTGGGHSGEKQKAAKGAPLVAMRWRCLLTIASGAERSKILKEAALRTGRLTTATVRTTCDMCAAGSAIGNNRTVVGGISPRNDPLPSTTVGCARGSKTYSLAHGVGEPVDLLSPGEGQENVAPVKAEVLAACSLRPGRGSGLSRGLGVGLGSELPKLVKS